MTLPLDHFFAERVLKDKGELAHKELLARLFSLSCQGHLALDVDALSDSLQKAAETLPENPCVIKEGNYLYLQRSYRCQQQIAEHLIRMMHSTPLALELPQHLEGTAEQQVVERFAPLSGGFQGDRQASSLQILADEFGQIARPERGLKTFLVLARSLRRHDPVHGYGRV